AYSAFPLDSFEHNRAGIVGHSFAQGGRIIQRDKAHWLQQRLKALTVLCLASDRHRTEGSSVEGAVERHNARLGLSPGVVTGASRQLQRTFHSFRTAVG